MAKSTISEDISVVKETLERFGMGLITTIPGAAGGVKYIPQMTKENLASFLAQLCQELSQPDRILPGGYLYMADIICHQQWVNNIGKAFATAFKDLEPDYIVTIETKGIPLATVTSRAFNVPLVIIRDEGRVTEGSSVNINYLSGSTRQIQTMSLATRALPKGANVLIIDDFMRAGGTAKGMLDLVNEFEGCVLGIGVLVVTAEPREKLVDSYLALLELEKVDEKKREVHISPGSWINNIKGYL